MEHPIKIFGAKASIHMRYDGDIQSLAAKLSSGLMLPDFKIGPREDPPHDVLGSVEALAWELWLERDESIESFQYSLRMETEDAFDEIIGNRMHDLSPWLARYVSKICKVDSLVSGTRIVFRQGKPGELARILAEGG
jgi:hypothetical protein